MSSDELVLFADDGLNPVCIPLTIEDAEQLTQELNNVIEKMKESKNEY